MYGLAILGAGPAGIAIAQAFVETSVNVCLIEGGGLVGEHASQALYEGSSIGPLPFDASTSRMRAFGGSCNLWGGGCVPLAELDLAARDWVPHSGWPISHAELQPHYRRAQRFCGIGEQAFEPHSFREPLPHAERVRLPIRCRAVGSQGEHQQTGEHEPRPGEDQRRDRGAVAGMNRNPDREVGRAPEQVDRPQVDPDPRSRSPVGHTFRRYEGPPVLFFGR